jgi:hypothetical protein
MIMVRKFLSLIMIISHIAGYVSPLYAGSYSKSGAFPEAA